MATSISRVALGIIFFLFFLRWGTATSIREEKSCTILFLLGERRIQWQLLEGSAKIAPTSTLDIGYEFLQTKNASQDDAVVNFLSDAAEQSTCYNAAFVIPSYFTQSDILTLQSFAQHAELKVQFIRQHAALSRGLSELPANGPHTAIVDLSESSTIVSIVTQTQDTIRVEGIAWDFDSSANEFAKCLRTVWENKLAPSIYRMAEDAKGRAVEWMEKEAAKVLSKLTSGNAIKETIFFWPGASIFLDDLSLSAVQKMCAQSSSKYTRLVNAVLLQARLHTSDIQKVYVFAESKLSVPLEHAIRSAFNRSEIVEVNTVSDVVFDGAAHIASGSKPRVQDRVLPPLQFNVAPVDCAARVSLSVSRPIEEDMYLFVNLGPFPAADVFYGYYDPVYMSRRDTSHSVWREGTAVLGSVEIQKKDFGISQVPLGAVLKVSFKDDAQFLHIDSVRLLPTQVNEMEIRWASADEWKQAAPTDLKLYVGSILSGASYTPTKITPTIESSPNTLHVSVERPSTVETVPVVDKGGASTALITFLTLVLSTAAVWWQDRANAVRSEKALAEQQKQAEAAAAAAASAPKPQQARPRG